MKASRWFRVGLTVLALGAGTAAFASDASADRAALAQRQQAPAASSQAAKAPDAPCGECCAMRAERPSAQRSADFTDHG